MIIAVSVAIAILVSLLVICFLGIFSSINKAMHTRYRG